LSKSGNQNFEQSVTRLLTLIGIPAINYSSGNDRRPDISATIKRDGRKPLVLLGECTSERPVAKFSALRQRASELSTFLESQADMLLAVFTQCEPVPSDYDLASEHGIALIGKRELEQLFQRLKSPATLEESVTFLRSLVNSSEIGFSLIRQSQY